MVCVPLASLCATGKRSLPVLKCELTLPNASSEAQGELGVFGKSRPDIAEMLDGTEHAPHPVHCQFILPNKPVCKYFLAQLLVRSRVVAPRNDGSRRITR